MVWQVVVEAEMDVNNLYGTQSHSGTTSCGMATTPTAFSRKSTIRTSGARLRVTLVWSKRVHGQVWSCTVKELAARRVHRVHVRCGRWLRLRCRFLFLERSRLDLLLARENNHVTSVSHHDIYVCARVRVRKRERVWRSVSRG
jgi:hypothetical protein